MPPMSGHGGVKKTYEALKETFYFPKMKAFVEEYVHSCPSCQRNNAANHKKFGLLHPIPMDSKPWTDISMDLIGPLTVSGGYNAILVVVDRFSKMMIAVPTNMTVSAKGLATLFIDRVLCAHGIP